ncbi:probable lipid-A-disaccharide synthase, mitochondrial isoform X1 [Physcomitrium patens]|uniref:lipid-A-disaccharide synthase n=1 Tax=Physcomitrium patens TaxID=3218 RepID=A0A2K1JXI2_PHYPA|nr:probable lipid-A-disaccharide synthase, mitochondrial isoform X1 [Physcomitrium patens]PNR46236.1 hypothetical protein PHYPA_013355 [Physcomitrium patens]|eukprot:XP_024386780.1 probable lipid-A-disaccharide synthase, mitochondrial isoform X1 [Physcomitrella patens]
MLRQGLLFVKRSLGGAAEWRISDAVGQKYPRFASPLSNVASDAGDSEEDLRVFIVAGEPSGDVIGSRLMGSLRRLSPKPLRFAGVGGANMEKEGLDSVFKMEDITVMGAAELFPHMFRIWRRLRQTVAEAVDFEPHVVVTVDAKGFSFRVLRSLTAIYEKKKEQPPFLVHYVAPSYWAWKGGDARLDSMKEFVDHLLCILPFEAPMCKAHGLGATFVGHPVLEDAYMNVPSAEHSAPRNWEIQGFGTNFREKHGVQSGTKIISVLPGSRVQEVKRMLPLFRIAMHRLAEDYPHIKAVVPTAQSSVVTNMVQESVSRWEIPAIVVPAASDLEKYDAFAASDAGLCTSGTASMQLLLARVPSVVAYRANPITEWLIKSRTKLEYISLPNILLNSPVVPEALFGECTPERLASLLKQVLEDHQMQELQRTSADQVLSMLSPPSSSLLHSSGALLIEDEHSEKPSMAAAATILEFFGLMNSPKKSPISY